MTKHHGPRPGRDKPPTVWFGGAVVVVDAEVGIYYVNPADPIVWHWCSTNNRWIASATDNHTIESQEPLTLSPSLLFSCCELHGFIKEGKWVLQ